jgi:hypothetical protein
VKATLYRPDLDLVGRLEPRPEWIARLTRRRRRHEPRPWQWTEPPEREWPYDWKLHGWPA